MYVSVTDFVIQAVVTGLVSGGVVGVAAVAAIRIELKYLRRDTDDNRAHIQKLYNHIRGVHSDGK